MVKLAMFTFGEVTSKHSVQPSKILAIVHSQQGNNQSKSFSCTENAFLYLVQMVISYKVDVIG